MGAVIGGGLNAQTLNSALEEIDVLYRERFLTDRYGAAGPDSIGAATFSAAPTADVPGVLDIIDAEMVEEDDNPGDEAEQP